MENDDFEITLARVRDLARNPAFQAFADEYMQHRRIYGNTDKIFGNHRPIRDDYAKALRIVYEEQPEAFHISATVIECASHLSTASQEECARWEADATKAFAILTTILSNCPDEWKFPLQCISILIIFLRRELQSKRLHKQEASTSSPCSGVPDGSASDSQP